MALAVNEPNDEIRALQAQWAKLEALDGGTPKMREAGTGLLPKWPAEEVEAYSARLQTATLFPAWKRTVNVMSGKPFSKALTLKDAAPSIQRWAEDIDQQGVSLHSFAAEMFREDVGYGLAGILVDYPRVPAGAFRSRAEQEASGQRPYWVRVKHGQILGWRTALVGGKVQLSQLRLLETHEEEDGEFGTKLVPQVRVLRPGFWSLYRETVGTGQRKSWALVESGTTSLDAIPFVPLYGVREGFMSGKPPLLDVAYLNIKHWQSQSDQDTILHAARVPILAIIGADDQSALTVGASSAVKIPAGGDMKFVEHSGAAIEAGAKSLADLEQQMIQAGAELLVKKPGDRSATEAANDAEGNKSDLQRIAENFADALDQALVFTAMYADIPVEQAGSVELYDGYGEATLGEASAKLIKELWQGGLISRETAIAEFKRRGDLAPEVDAVDEAAKVAEEGPPLGMMGTAPDDEGAEDA
jgi:hypothetical protein